ncbi:serpentine type 7TM GPCR receptor class ab chemoreceptor domain-containing protein [Ditylenchus destructor]|nr:serpentine type 7TM GPCR receptor class ab chemoreceptor domain-containing protein [Ditylenchus destructor]
MNDSDTEKCNLAANLSKNFPTRIHHVQHMFGCVLGIAALLYFVIHPKKMPHLFLGATRIITWWLIGFLILHNSCLLIVTIWEEVLYFTYVDKCDLLIRTWQCLIFRIPTISSIIAMSFIHLVLLLDRLLETFFPQWCAVKARPKAHIIVPFSLLCFVAPLTVLVFYSENMLDYKYYCVASSSTNNNRLMIIYLLLFIIDLLCTVGFIFILRKSFSRLKRNEHGFVVNRKLKMRTDIASTRFTLVETSIRCVLFGIFLLSNFLFRQLIPFDDFIQLSSWIDGFYIIQWYGVCLGLLLFNWRPFLVGHSNTHEVDANEERNIHFKQLNVQWNTRKKP